MKNNHQVGGDHYLNMGVQPFDFFDTQPIEQQIAYHKFTAIAYLMRAGSKGSEIDDIRKAHHHLEKLINEYDAAEDK